MKKLLTINQLKDFAGTLQMLGHTPLSSCKTYIVNGEICVDKQELLTAVSNNGGINAECFTRSEVIKVLGNLSHDFPPDYQIDNEELWETYRVKERVFKQFNLKGYEIDKYIKDKLKSAVSVIQLENPVCDFYNTQK